MSFNVRFAVCPSDRVAARVGVDGLVVQGKGVALEALPYGYRTSGSRMKGTE